MRYHDPWDKEDWITFMEEAICPNVNGRSCTCKDKYEDPCTCPLNLTEALEELYDAGFRNIEELEFQTDCKKKKQLPEKEDKKEDTKKEIVKKEGWYVQRD